MKIQEFENCIQPHVKPNQGKFILFRFYEVHLWKFFFALFFSVRDSEMSKGKYELRKIDRVDPDKAIGSFK